MEIRTGFERFRSKVALTVALASLGNIAIAPTQQVQAEVALDPDFDDDGLRNDIDVNMLTFDGTDVDGDKIPNSIDKLPYFTDVADADYDRLSNQWDRQPYMPIFQGLGEISNHSCAVSYDSDCDQIFNTQDRFPNYREINDADFDGQPNGSDKHPYIPFAVTSSLYDNIIDISFFCLKSTDEDCDGVLNSIDPDDYIAEFPDVDGDGIENKYDQFPYFNSYLSTINAQAVPTRDPSGRLSVPIVPVTNKTNQYYIYKTFYDMMSRDDDGDGLKDIFDPYPNTYDWDNDGRPDGYDSQISVNQDRVEEQRQEERRQDQRTEDKRLEDQRQEARQQDKRLEEQRLQDDLENKRLEEKRLRDQQERQRQEDERQRQRDIERQRQRDEDIYGS